MTGEGKERFILNIIGLEGGFILSCDKTALH